MGSRCPLWGGQYAAHHRDGPVMGQDTASGHFD